MNKKRYYLPNLNELFLQHRNFKRSKSSYDYVRQVALQGGKGRLGAHVSSEATWQPTGRQQCSLDLKKSISPSSFMNHGNSPRERRRWSQRQAQNMRMVKALQYSNPSTYSYDYKREKERQQLRQRIGKYVKQGHSISYKFKKSLAEIQHRKNNKKVLEIDNPIKEDAFRQQLLMIQNQRAYKNVNLKPCDDIYCHNFINSSKNQEKVYLESEKGARTQMSKAANQSELAVHLEEPSFDSKRAALKQAVVSRMNMNKRSNKQPLKQSMLLRVKRLRPPSDLQIVGLPPLRCKTQV